MNDLAIASFLMLILDVFLFHVLRLDYEQKQFKERFGNNCRKECCLPGRGSEYSCADGCLCLSSDDRDFLYTRGLNRTFKDEI
jgi:hypothetical protein